MTTWPPSTPWCGRSTPIFHCVAVSDGDALVVEVVRGEPETRVPDDVALTRFSTGTTFSFEDRGTPVELRSRRPERRDLVDVDA